MQFFILPASDAGQWTTYEENAALKYREREEEQTLTLIKLGANRRRGAELTLLVGDVISSAHKCAGIGQQEPTSDVRKNDKERTAEPCPN